MLQITSKLLLALCAAAVVRVPTAEAAVHAAVTAPAVRAFNTAAYGTIGDGVTDDSAAIGRAVQAAVAAGGGRVVFPCGQFLLNTTSRIAPGQRSMLFFSGANNIQITGSGVCSHLFTTVAAKSVLEFQGSTGISIASLRISAVNAPYVETFGLDGGSAVRFTGVTGGRIQTLEIDGASAGAIYLTGGTSQVTVSGNNIHDTYGAGIWEDDCSGANNQNCLPSRPPSGNIYKGNTLRNTALAALSAIDLDDGSAVSGAVVANNTVTWTRLPLPGNNMVHCIQLNNASGVRVKDNTCTGTPWDGIVVTTGPGGSANADTIEDNVVNASGRSSIGGSGIVIYNDPKGLGISRFVLRGNVVSGSASDGIVLYSASGARGVQDGSVLRNKILNADQQNPGRCSGIHLVKTVNAKVAGNTVHGGGKSIAFGVLLESSPGTGISPTSNSNQVTAILGPVLSIR
jgi:hypothetical protein